MRTRLTFLWFSSHALQIWECNYSRDQIRQYKFKHRKILGYYSCAEHFLIIFLPPCFVIISIIAQKPTLPLGNFHQKWVIQQNSVHFCSPKSFRKSLYGFGAGSVIRLKNSSSSEAFLPFLLLSCFYDYWHFRDNKEKRQLLSHKDSRMTINSYKIYRLILCILFL